MSDVIIQKVTVDFAVNQPDGNYADFSICNVADPVDPDSTTTPEEPGDLGKTCCNLHRIVVAPFALCDFSTSPCIE